MADTLMVGMAEVKVSRNMGDTLVALGLGSCVGICLYDPYAVVAGMAHVVLPASGGQDATPGKFANTAVPHLIEMMLRSGASLLHIKVALAGGAQLFAFNTAAPKLDIGPRNVQAVLDELATKRLRPQASDIGGNVGRTLQMTLDGVVRVKSIGQGERELTRLGRWDAAAPALAAACASGN